MPRNPAAPLDFLGVDAPGQRVKDISTLLFGLRSIRTALCHVIVSEPDLPRKFDYADHVNELQSLIDDAANRVETLTAPGIGSNGFDDDELPTLVQGVALEPSRESIGTLSDWLLNFSRATLVRCGTISDGPSVLLLERSSSFLQSLAEWSENRPLGIDRGTDRDNTSLQTVEDWESRVQWAEFPREPARDSRIRVLDDAGFHAHQIEHELDPSQGRFWLHWVAFIVEVCATEACALILGRYPETPDHFQRKFARQLWDESRHARMLLSELALRGGQIDDFPVHTKLYEYVWHGKSAAECTCRENVIGEGFAILSFALSARERFAGLDEPRLARIYEWMYVDEIQHVRTGLLLFRELAGESADEMMRRLEANHPELAPSTVVEEVSRFVGFTPEEILRQRAMVARGTRGKRRDDGATSNKE